MSRQRFVGPALVLVAAAGLAACGSMLPGKAGMGFFLTSTGPGDGGNLGGLAGADCRLGWKPTPTAHCSTCC